MSKEFQEWVGRVRGAAERRWLRTIEGLRGENAELARRLRTLESSPDLAAAEDELARRVEALTAEADTLQVRVDEASKRIEAERRAAAIASLERVERLLAANEALAYQQVVEDAEALLGIELRSGSTAEVRRRIRTKKSNIDRARAAIVSHLTRAASRADASRDVRAQLQSARERTRTADAATAEITEQLRARHDVNPDVTQALRELPSNLADRLFLEVVEPFLTDALAEASWGLSGDVLGEVRDGLDDRTRTR